MTTIAIIKESGKLFRLARATRIWQIRNQFKEIGGYPTFQCPYCFGGLKFRHSVAPRLPNGLPDLNADPLRSACFEHLDRKQDRVCADFENKQLSIESQAHKQLKQLQSNRLAIAIQENFRTDSLLIVPERTVKAGKKHRRPDVGLVWKDKAIAGAEIQLSSLPPKDFMQRLDDHHALGLHGVLWSMGGDAQHLMDQAIRRYGSVQSAYIDKQEIRNVDQNGFIRIDEKLISTSLTIWTYDVWTAVNSSRSDRAPTIEDDSLFIESAIKASEIPGRKYFDAPPLPQPPKIQSSKIIPCKRREDQLMQSSDSPERAPTQQQLDPSQCKGKTLLEVEEDRLVDFVGCTVEVRSVLTGKVKFCGQLLEIDLRNYHAVIRSLEDSDTRRADLRECFPVSEADNNEPQLTKNTEKT